MLRGNHKPHVTTTLHSAIKCSQLKTKAMTSELKNNVIENKKERSLVVKLKKCCKKDFFTILKQKITLNRFGQLLSHISPINM